MNARLGLIAATLCAVGTQAFAAPNLVQNGDFSSYTAPTVTSNGSPVVVGELATVDANAPGFVNSNGGDAAGGGTSTGWKNDGYTFLFTPGTADTSGSYSNKYGAPIKMQGSNDGGSVVLPSSSPNGGNYLALDGDPNFNGALYQSVSGLSVGSLYYISFYFAGAQQAGYSGVTTEQLLVGIGGAVPATNGQYQFQTAVLTTPDKGFTPWQQASFTFTANAVSEVLSFLSVGTPAGAPPFALLDGVSLTAAPEPSTWAIMVAGLGVVTFAGRAWRRRTTTPATTA